MLELPIGIQEVTNEFATGTILNASLANEVKMSYGLCTLGYGGEEIVHY